jgi:hypothetical protein
MCDAKKWKYVWVIEWIPRERRVTSMANVPLCPQANGKDIDYGLLVINMGF